MRLEDEKVLVEVDRERMHSVYVGTAPDDATLVTTTTFVPNVTLHLRMSPAKAREIAAALKAFADQGDANAIASRVMAAARSGEFHRESRA